MSAVLSIARRDIIGLLSAPKAAGIFWFFLMIMGVFFYVFVSRFLEMQQMAPMTGQEAPGVDQLMRALFQNLHFILILVIPAVTMSSFSEEMKSHTLRFLQTSPVTSFAIVMGKFVALAGVMSLVLLFTGVYPWYLITYGEPDIGIILSSYLGVFLLICSQLSFGMWISSMTSNQFMAFLFTIFGMFLLLILDWIAPSLAGGGVAEEVVKYLAATTHLEAFLKGMISVKDVVYFLCFTATFLFFTNVVIDSQRWR